MLSKKKKYPTNIHKTTQTEIKIYQQYARNHPNRDQNISAQPVLAESEREHQNKAGAVPDRL
jgi:hypothetical protein